MTGDDILFTDSEKLRDTILGELGKNEPPEDRSGRSLLQEIAVCVKRLPIHTKELSTFTTAGIELLQQVPKLTPKETSQLVTFLSACKNSTSQLKLATIDALKHCTANGSDKVSKRADLLRLAYKLGNILRPEEIEKEDAVRKIRPWAWFDIAVGSNKMAVKQYVRTLGKLPDFAKAMTFRLPFLYKILGDAFGDFVLATQSCLSGNERKMFEKTLGLITEINNKDRESYDMQGNFSRIISELALTVPSRNTFILT